MAEFEDDLELEVRTHDVLEWLKTLPDDHQFDQGIRANSCLLAQHLRAHGYPKATVGMSTAEANGFKLLTAAQQLLVRDYDSFCGQWYAGQYLNEDSVPAGYLKLRFFGAAEGTDGQDD